MKAMLVDDDEISLEILQRAVRQAGYEVLTARNGREALARLAQGDCRLVVSDWDMPEMDGIQLCQAVRAGNFPGYVYFILLTGFSDPKYIVQGLSAGADDFIAKPFDPGVLTVRLRVGQRVLSIETRDVAIFAMAKLAESRDPETGAHLDRVRGYCQTLAAHLSGLEAYAGQIDAEFVRMIYLTSPLHDIGKVGIPDAVLLKNGRLSDREFEIMKMHSSMGAQTLEAALKKFPGTRFLEMGRDIAATHHERFDGSGYPAKLVGKDIPLAGRITALADVYDALTSRRVYKLAFTHEVAKSIILQESGTHFDPDITAAFLACEQQFLDIRRQFNDEQPAQAA